MFEKEAKEYAEPWKTSLAYIAIKEAFQKGAEFAYKKANEWHFVKDGKLPKECENVWCYCIGPGFKYCCVGHTIVNGNNEVMWWANNKSEELRVIAWKEIILPELKEAGNAADCM